MRGSGKTLALLSIIRLLVISFTFTVIIHPGLWLALADGYSNDYLFNLSGPQIAGLTVITGILALLLFIACVVSSYLLCKWIHCYVPRWFVIMSCIALALLLCAVALLLVPQLHYQYYRTFMPDLPLQWVPLGDLSVNTLWRYLLLPADDNTTHHAKGVTVWTCVTASALVAFEESRAVSRKY